MAIFGKKKDTAEVPSTPAKTVVAKKVAPHNMASIIVKPRITEKAALLLDKNVYTFEINPKASKYDVRDAIKALYNVTPEKVHIVKKDTRHYMSRARGRKLTEKGMKKAYVYLKEGDRIDLV